MITEDHISTTNHPASTVDKINADGRNITPSITDTSTIILYAFCTENFQRSGALVFPAMRNIYSHI